MKLSKEQADNLVKSSIQSVAGKLSTKFDKPVNLCVVAIMEKTKQHKKLSAMDVIMSMQLIDLDFLTALEARIKSN